MGFEYELSADCPELCFKNGSRIDEQPQGLKPAFLKGLSGTDKQTAETLF